MSSAKLRVLKAIGERGLWKPIGRVHGWLYRATDGRVGHSAGGITNLLLTTSGRRSGEPRTVTLAYLRHADTWVLVASNGGSDHHPAWWLNLQKDPRAKIQVAAKLIDVIASEEVGEARAQLWRELTRYNPMYANYEQMTARLIPVVVLRRRP